MSGCYSCQSLWLVYEILPEDMPISRLIVLLLLIGLVSGCAGFQTAVPETDSVDTAQPVPEPVTEPVEASQLDPKLLWALLVGEVAGQRGQLGTATQAYLEAARESRDPAVVTRAVQIALFSNDLKSARKGLDVLLDIQPQQALPHRLALTVALKENDLDDALEHARAILAYANAPYRTTLLALSAFMLREADPNQTLALLQKLMDDSPDPAAVQYAQSQVAGHARDLTLAETAAQATIRLDPDWAAAYVQLASIYDQTDRTDEAIALLGPVAERLNDVALRMTYGQLLAKAKAFPAAAKQFQRILDQQPDFHGARMALALVHIQQEKLDLAAKDLTQLVNVADYHDRAAFYLGRIARWDQQPDVALKWFESIEEGRLLQEAMINIALIKAEQGDFDQAKELFVELREQTPDQASDFYLMEGEMLRDAGEFDAFYALMNEAVDADPENLKLRYARALAAVEVDHFEVLESDLRLVLAANPEDVDALNALGYSLASETERFDEAEQLLEKAIRIRPDDPAILDSVGWLRYRQGQYEQALEYLQRAYAKHPDDEIAAHLGQVLWSLGRKQEAKDLWEQVSKQKPDSRHIQKVLEQFK